MPKSSANRCKKEIRTAALKCLEVSVSYVFQVNGDTPTLSQLDDLLEPKMSVSLADMNIIDPKNRRPNEEFSVMLKRKLRLFLWPHE